MQRDQATPQEVDAVIDLFRKELQTRIDKHGYSKFVSRAEGLGTLVEEYDEVKDAMRGNNLQEFLDEMMDVAVAAIWTVLSLRIPK